MNIEKVGPNEYSKMFNNPYIPYNTVAFNQLNRDKCNLLEFYLFYEGKVKLGLIAGIIGHSLLSPFSAPFASFSNLKNNINVHLIIDAIAALENYSLDQHIDSLKFVLPPGFYYEHFISKLIYAFYYNHFSVLIDLNQVFYTRDFVKYENNEIDRRIRNKLKKAIQSDLEFKKVNSMEEYKVVYDVIRQNKEAKNRPVRMTFEQVLEMRVLVNIDFFMVSCRNMPIASSIVYNYNPQIVHIIYWGDKPGCEHYYPMNFLAWNIFKYYRDKNIEIIDLANSSENGVPNFGLFNFKESIGCSVIPKCTFIKKI